MNRTIKLAILGFAAVVCGATGASAQKFGYVNLQEIVMAMPEKDTAQEQLQRISQDYSEQLEIMQVELNTGIQDYEKNLATMSDAARKAAEKKLRDLQSRLQESYSEAQQIVQKKEAELMQPIIEKAQNAIKKVGVDNGYAAIFESTTLLYMDEKTMTDVTPLVKKALGIK